MKKPNIIEAGEPKTQYRVGQMVRIQASGELEESFEGPVTRIDEDNYLVFARNEDSDEIWGMPMCFVTPLEVA